ncbi:MAG: hypothetical protein N2484_13665 [Clostridia bacterium]|nr:hypothetical protein [Clostridia bacterium]
MMKVFTVITPILLLLTIGCGFSIRYGGEAFKTAVKGHMLLGVLTLISMSILTILIFKSQQGSSL